jgi:hypothetical protein
MPKNPALRNAHITLGNIYNSTRVPILAPVETFTDWDRFQSLVSDLISPSTQINTFEDAEERARKFTASMA